MNKKEYSLLEAVAEIAFIAAGENYETKNRREKISQFIQWGKDFEYLHRHIKWGINSKIEYIDSIYLYTKFRIEQHRTE